MQPTILALFAAQTAPVPVPVPASDEPGDARCLVAFAAIGGSGETAQQDAAKLGALYFYGRLVGRNPRIDLVATMRAATVAVQPQIKTELTRCAAQLQAAGLAMQAAGTALTRK